MADAAKIPPQDGPAQDGPAGPPPPATRGWVKVLLAVSLALNLGVAGLAVGAFVRNGGPPARMEGRDFGLGPMGDALTREDRRALRRAFLQRFPELKAGRAALQADFAALTEALTAEPFEPDAVRASIAVIAERNSERLSTIRDILAEYLVSLSPEARAGFAERLQAALGRADRRDKEDSKDDTRDKTGERD
jgi:uncharacterized membrane protein